ncbi:hypothetical protein GGS21DRAFT_540223 [Xylaria nigripes]|nr:hypothetical protein GGS21DRAFT_540223 [Xylaria nigripes]
MGSTGGNAGLEARPLSPNPIDNETSLPPSANIDRKPSIRTSASTSVTASPVESRDPSRDPSPTKICAKMNRTPTSPVLPRKNSAQDPSPPRKRSSIPTPAISRQLSASAIPSFLPPSGTDTASRASAPQKPSSGALELSKDSPRWPISPRLKSPPPSFSRPTVASAARRGDLELPIINVQRATPSPHAEPKAQPAADVEVEEVHLSSGMRTPGRGPSSGSSILETVQEVSQPNTPRQELNAAIKKLEETSTSEGAARDRSPDTAYSSAKSSQTASNSESGSDSGSVKTYKKRYSSTVLPPLLHNRQSSSALKFSGRGQPSGESSSRNMTVETEEVKDMPQLSLVPNAGGQRVNGSLRTRPSNETIKPKKDKKKQTRKTTSIPSGNASSKADIFEAKVASAVEEANSTDSDETFVYDSNPPDAERPRRYHSRTPSVASMASQVDRNGLRSMHAVFENGAPNVHVKKNMKFVNTYTSNGNENLQGDDDGRGTGRSNVGSARGTARHHHHHGRWGRNNGNTHPSLFDNESPFHAARSGLPGPNSRPPSIPTSPQSSKFNRSWLPSSKRQIVLSNNGYSMSDTTPADDERTPLLQNGTVRTSRSNRNRRHVTLRNLESQTYHRNTSFLNRCASCLVLIVMLLLVITGAIGFMFATSQPLTDVALLKIGNVLASEQELMFDLTVQAQNPNVVVVMIDSADIEVFAKSPHAGNDSEWWRHPQGDTFEVLDDPKNDPPSLSDPTDEDSSPNMRLGNIHTFDSPLTYEGSFFHRGFTTSSGELRLAHPGNTTDSGTARWERIIADDFTLVIKGVLKYTLPLSHKVRKVSISGKTLVKSNAANDPALRPNEPEISISKKPTTWTA